jgi:hypothetical protein
MQVRSQSPRDSKPFNCLYIAKGQPKKEPEIAIVTQDLLRSIRDETAKKPGRQAAILDQKEIDRMKASTKIETVEDIKEQTKLA